MIHVFAALLVPALAGGTLPTTAGQRDELAGFDLIHRTKAANYDGIVGRYLGTNGQGEAEHEVVIRPTLGYYKNLTIVDFERLIEGDPLQYVYFSREDAGAMSVFMNISPFSRHGTDVRAETLTLKVRGADAIAAAQGRVFYRRVDKTVAIYGEYRGVARVIPSRHRTA